MLASWTATLVRALRARGLDGERLAAEAGIDVGLFAVDGERIPLSQTTRLWQLAIDVTGDQCFGLEVARYARPSTFVGLSAGIISSTSFRDALQRLARYPEIALTPSGEVEVYERSGCLTWRNSFASLACRPCFESMEAITACITRSGRFLLGRSLSPLVVHLSRPRRPDNSRFEEFFGCPVRYGCPEYRLDFAVDVVDRRLPGSASLALAADRMAQSYVDQLAPTIDFSGSVRSTVASLVFDAELSIPLVARHLAVSPRTLQRRLGAEGTSFRRIITEVRTDLARELLVVDGLSVEAVSARLRFHDAASFRRSFKRSTGMTPAEFVAWHGAV